MARTVEEAPITTSASRNKLAARPKPYYRTIEPDLHLGFRKGKTGGRWVVRYYTGNGKYRVETFAKAVTSDTKAYQSLDYTKVDERTPLDFRQAQRIAKEIHTAHLATGVSGLGTPLTVSQVVADYIDWLRQHRKSAVTAERFANVHIYPKLGKIEAAKLTSDQINNWLVRISESPRRKRTAKDADPVFGPPAKTADEKRARRSTANRVRAVLVAALNRAYQDGKLPSDTAWRRVRPFRGTEKSRTRYLSRDECRRLINACDPDMRALVRGALYCGARYGSLCQLNVSDFDLDSGTFHFQQTKSGKPYYVHLNAEAVTFFQELTAGRPGSDAMFKKADGSKWRDSHQHRPFKAAIERARITPPASFHTLRHTFASLAIMAGAPLHVVAANLGHRDDQMVQRHYGHLADDYRAKIMRETAPEFGLEDSNLDRIA